MEKGTIFTCVCTFLLILLLIFYMYFRIRNKRNYLNNSKLPPGSMGWPYIGETIQLYSQDPNHFFATRNKRYGEIFKTRILGCPCVMLSSPEAARFVLVTQAHLFKPTYPKSKENLIGPWALFFHRGDYHQRIRKLVQKSFNPETIRNHLPDIQSIVVSVMDSWQGGHIVNIYQDLKKFSFEVGILAIFGHLDFHRKRELRKNYSIVNQGYNSFPTNLPGTFYSRALQARNRLSVILREIIQERRKRKTTIEKINFLSSLLDYKDEEGQTLSEPQIADNVIGVLFAAQDTTATAMTWVLKYLHENQTLLEAVKAEQKTIYLSNEKDGIQLTWTQTRNMPITHKVILESLRMASIISFTFREAMTDVVFKGYLIPKGWKVMPLFRNIHHNPEFFTDPQKFDPSRFEVAPKRNTFIAFGSGVHSCPGNELAKLEMLVMIHHLVTRFRFEVVGSESGIKYDPFPVPLDGVPARFWKD